MTGLWIGAAVVAGVAIGLPAVVVSLIVGALMRYARQWTTALAVVIVIAAGLGALRTYDGRLEQPTIQVDEIVAFRGTVDRVAATRATLQSFIVDVDEVMIGNAWQSASLRLWVSSPVQPAVGRNDRVYVVGTFESLAQIDPGFADYLSADDVDGSGYGRRLEVDATGTGWRRAVDDLAGAIRDRLQTAVPGDKGILLSGFVTGDDARLSSARQARFIVTGTTHLTAVSGANLALIVFILAAAGQRLGVQRWIPWLIAIAVAFWAYAVLVGLETPVVRAAIVATFAVFAGRVGRRPDFVTLIALTAAIQALVHPGDVGRISYQLSIASSIALVLALAGDPPIGVLGWLKSALLATWAAQMATIAFLLPTFGQINWTSVPANLLVAPAASIAFALACLATLLFGVSETLGTAVAEVAGLGSGYIIAVVDFLGSSPGSVTYTGDIGPGGQALVTAVSIGGVAMMSVECRQAVRRWWTAAEANQEVVAILIGSTVTGAAAGWVIAAAI